jgi:DNA-binding transcriptional LysR family regulator
MDLRLLRSFVAVAEDLSFSRAAARLRIAQPALSRQIGLLESELGGKLFERTKRRVELTESGARFLDEARLTLAQFERTVAVGRNAMTGQLGLLRVAVTGAAMFNPLTAELLHACRTRWPRLGIELHEMPATRQNPGLEDGSLELGFMHVDAELLRGGRLPPWPKLQLHVLAREGLVAAVAIGHPLASRSSLKLAELADETFLTLPRRYSPEYAGPFHRLERLRGSPVRLAQEVLNAPAMVHLAGAGLGIALVPQCMTSIHAPRVRYIPVSDETESRLLALVSARGANRPAVANFIELASKLSPSRG